MIVTYNTKLEFESQEDSDKIFEILKAHLFCVNECSKIHFGAKKNSLVELHKKFYKKFRDENPHIPAQIVVRAINEVLSNYRSIKSKKHKITKPILKGNLSIRLDKKIYSCNGEELKLSTFQKRVLCQCSFYKYPKLQELLAQHRLCNPLLFVKNNEIWIALSFEINSPLILEKSVCGIDLGIKNFVATSEGGGFKR